MPGLICILSSLMKANHSIPKFEIEGNIGQSDPKSLPNIQFVNSDPM